MVWEASLVREPSQVRVWPRRTPGEEHPGGGCGGGWRRVGDSRLFLRRRRKKEVNLDAVEPTAGGQRGPATRAPAGHDEATGLPSERDGKALEF